jgi:hypothetical protein
MLGRPLPRVIWSKDGEVLENSDKYEVSVDSNAALMIVNQPEKTDAGVYGIEIYNDFGRDETSFKVNILGKLTPRVQQLSPDD